jgi:hypothetical protein
MCMNIRMNKMKMVWALAISIFTTVYGFGAISVTAPSSGETLTASEDFASAAFQDPWDMNEQTDLGWFIYDVTSGSKSNLSSITFSSGIFSASSSSEDPNISILETGVTGTCFLGKIGVNYKIDADKYKIFAIRLKLDKTSGSYEDGLLFWSRNTIYNDMSMSKPGGFRTYSGWGIYIVNIPNLGYTKIKSKGYSWSGDIDSLRFDPCAESADIDIDWIRLVEDKSSLYRTVKWSGNTTNVDIFLDNDRNSSNGTLGVVAKNVSGKSYSLYAGALATGKYYVGVRSVNGGAMAYSSGYYQVNDIPTMTFTAPSEEGGDDFASVVLKNAWNMNSVSDLDGYANLSGTPFITTVSSVDRSGKSLGSISVLKGANLSGTPDPILYPLWFYEGRGATNTIDSDKYRILVLKMGLPGNWDLVGGSVARILWHVAGEFDGNSVELMNQSADVIIRHKSGTLVMDTIIADMKDLTLESSQSHTGWNGAIDGFRVDPHEFTSTKSFYIRNIKLAAYERADTSYTIKWEYTDSIASSSSLKLYYDTNNSGFNGTLIKSGITPTAEKYTWNTANMPEGTYYIYGVMNDGRNTNRTYARWPIVISHTGNPTAEIDLSRSHLDFGSVSGIATDPQTFLIENSGTGTMEWSVSTDQAWLTASPKSGTGSGVVSVSVNGSTLSRGTYTGVVTVSSANATNSPRTVSVTFNVYKAGTTDKPFGAFLTPSNGSNTSSSVAVTGWVLDDIGVAKVEIFNGSDYVGEAVFVEGARADIEAAYPGYPQNYQAGWGYMLLTHFLPNGGNGKYTLYAKATDKEGHQVTLGSSTITVDNANAVKPFGAIDTPAQGGTASGKSFTNIGWVLTPKPGKIKTDGSTIDVYVDSVKLGNPEYNQYRSDIATLFPDYGNSSGAMATFDIDTTKYSNGIHSIYWIAKDNAGNSDGIGSRFFIVQNTGSSSRTAAQANMIRRPFIPIDRTGSIGVIKGFDGESVPMETAPGPDGIFDISIAELDRVEILLDPAAAGMPRWYGYRLFGSELKPLPAGSTLDAERGIFYWAPAAGFVGDYELLFMDNAGDNVRRLNIIITPGN